MKYPFYSPLKRWHNGFACGACSGIVCSRLHQLHSALLCSLLPNIYHLWFTNNYLKMATIQKNWNNFSAVSVRCIHTIHIHIHSACGDSLCRRSQPIAWILLCNTRYLIETTTMERLSQCHPFTNGTWILESTMRIMESNILRIHCFLSYKKKILWLIILFRLFCLAISQPLVQICWKDISDDFFFMIIFSLVIFITSIC